MSEFNIEECAKCFVRRIGSPDRRSKRVDLLHEKWSGSLVDPAWINGALSTTALRQRPHSILAPKGGLGYAKAKHLAQVFAESFISELSRHDKAAYPHILRVKCEELTKSASNTGLYWTFGRSQKFLNILAKYWFCVAKGFPESLQDNERELVLSLNDYLDAPVDSVTLKHLRRMKDTPDLDGIYWGWNMTERKYDEIQRWIEDRASQIGLSKVAYELIEIW
jgi:hypothetical protein